MVYFAGKTLVHGAAARRHVGDVLGIDLPHQAFDLLLVLPRAVEVDGGADGQQEDAAQDAGRDDRVA